MANMSYCRFQNTLADFRDCAENIDDAVSLDEKEARARLIKEAYALLKENYLLDENGDLDLEAIDDLPSAAEYDDLDDEEEDDE